MSMEHNSIMMTMFQSNKRHRRNPRCRDNDTHQVGSHHNDHHLRQSVSPRQRRPRQQRQFWNTTATNAATMIMIVIGTSSLGMFPMTNSWSIVPSPARSRTSTMVFPSSSSSINNCGSRWNSRYDRNPIASSGCIFRHFATPVSPGSKASSSSSSYDDDDDDNKFTDENRIVDVVVDDGDFLSEYLDDSTNTYYDDGTFDDSDTNPEDWIPDSERAKQRRKALSNRDYLIPASDVLGTSIDEDDDEEDYDSVDNDTLSSAYGGKSVPSPYTDEEEELIAAMGGKQSMDVGVGHRRSSNDEDLKQQTQSNDDERQTSFKDDDDDDMTPRRREAGFLGDSTIEEIAMDYSVPVCYLADVLCGMWGVPVPINTKDRLGDLVTGEQAFALVEAVNSLDVAMIQDRYSNYPFQQLCIEWDIDLKKAFEYAMTQGWTLPFGIRTNLRQEQEHELLRVFSMLYEEDDDDDIDYKAYETFGRYGSDGSLD